MKAAREIVKPILERNRDIHVLVNKAIEDADALIEMLGRRDDDPDINNIVERLEGIRTSLAEHPNRNHEYACGAVFDITFTATRRVYARGNNEAVMLARQSFLTDDGAVAVDGLSCVKIDLVPTTDLSDCVMSWETPPPATQKPKKGL